MALSIATIDSADKAAKEGKKKETEETLLLLAPEAKAKLASHNGDAAKLTKKQACSLLLLVEYRTSVDDTKHLKCKLVDMLTDRIRMLGVRSEVAPTEASAPPTAAPTDSA